jgi:hypothetical protein
MLMNIMSHKPIERRLLDGGIGGELGQIRNHFSLAGIDVGLHACRHPALRRTRDVAGCAEHDEQVRQTREEKSRSNP